MDYKAKLSLINGTIWLGMFIVFSVSFLTSTYPTVLPMSNYRMTTSIILALANVSNVIILILKIKKEKADERNKKIESIAGSITLVGTMLIICLASLSLHVMYEDSGFVPNSWLWFLGTGLVFVVFIIFNLSYVIVSFKGTGYEN